MHNRGHVSTNTISTEAAMFLQKISINSGTAQHKPKHKNCRIWQVNN